MKYRIVRRGRLEWETGEMQHELVPTAAAAVAGGVEWSGEVTLWRPDRLRGLLSGPLGLYSGRPGPPLLWIWSSR